VRVKLNGALIAAKGAGMVARGRYRFLDRRLLGGGVFTYRLQAVGIDDTRSSLETTIVKR
jgi:hypothetical protein